MNFNPNTLGKIWQGVCARLLRKKTTYKNTKDDGEHKQDGEKG